MSKYLSQDASPGLKGLVCVFSERLCVYFNWQSHARRLSGDYYVTLVSLEPLNGSLVGKCKNGDND